MRILRVFPRRTSYTPSDALAYIGAPPFEALIEPHDEVHVSCVFAWDKEICRGLAEQWRVVTKKPVRLGGPAFGSPAADFTKGLYVKSNIVFTSRGCNNRCPWCVVPKLEGKLKELPVVPGNIIQDNNFLQTSKAHRQKVYGMLKTQKAVCFKGGLETDFVTPGFADELNGLYYMRGSKKVSRIAELWLACDTDGALPRLRKAVDILKRAGFNRNKVYCYALIGDDMTKNEARLKEIYAAGAMPFAQLYQPLDGESKKEYDDDWKRSACTWSRPAATKAHAERGTRR